MGSGGMARTLKAGKSAPGKKLAAKRIAKKGGPPVNTSEDKDRDSNSSSASSSSGFITKSTINVTATNATADGASTSRAAVDVTAAAPAARPTVGKKAPKMAVAAQKSPRTPMTARKSFPHSREAVTVASFLSDIGWNLEWRVLRRAKRISCTVAMSHAIFSWKMLLEYSFPGLNFQLKLCPAALGNL